MRIFTHPTLRYPAQHPKAGLALEAVGFVGGRPVWPIMGGSPDGEGDGDGAGAGNGSGAAAGQQAGEQAGGQAGAAAGAAAGEAAGQAAGQGSEQAAAAEKVEDLPDWAQKLIKDTRGEAAEHRTKAAAAEKKQAEALDAIAKALGLKKDEQVDPAELAKQLDEQKDAARQAAIELAVFRVAGKHKGDPDALLDSRTFQAKVADLDPTDSKFADKVDTAIKDAVKDNPKLQATQAAGSSSADHAGGSGSGGGKPKSLEEAIAGQMA